MLRSLLSALVMGAFLAGTAQAAATCDAQADEKKLAGAARTSFVKKCTTDGKGAAAPAVAKAEAGACDMKADEKKLAGAARNSFVKKCKTDMGAPAAAPAGGKCEATADEKKLAGAARTSFLKKCNAG